MFKMFGDVSTPIYTRKACTRLDILFLFYDKKFLEKQHMLIFDDNDNNKLSTIYSSEQAFV